MSDYPLGPEQSPGRTSSSLWQTGVLFSVAYLVCAEAGRYFSGRDIHYVNFWLPGGLYVAVLLLNPQRAWLWLALAALPASVAFDVLVGTPWVTALLFYGANTLQAMTGAWLVRRFVSRQPTLATLGEALGLLGFAVVVGPFLGAALGAGTLRMSGLSPSFVQSALVWWGSNALAILLLAPFILAWFAPSGAKLPRIKRSKKLLEAALLLCVLVGLAGQLVVVSKGILGPYEFLLLLPLLWAGLRFGPRGAATANLFVALLTFYLTRFYVGAEESRIASRDYIFVLQTFLAVAALVALVPAIVLGERDRTTAELRESEERFRILTTAAFEGIGISENGRIVDVNDQLLRLFGCERGEILGREILEFVAPESRLTVAESIRLGREDILELRLLRTDGSSFVAEARARNVRVGSRSVRMAAIRDITVRKQAEELTGSQRRLLEMIATGKPMLETLDALVRMTEAQSSEILGSILLLDPDGIHIRHGAAPSLPVDYWKAIDGAAIGPCAGSCGTAAYRRESVFVPDIASDPLWADYRHLALPHGLRACWSTPILDAQRNVLGTFAIYYRHPGMPNEWHRKLIDMATQTAAVCIAKHRSDQALRESEEKFSKAFRSCPDAVVLSELDTGRYIDINEGFERLFGYSRDEVIGRTALELGIYHDPGDRPRLVEQLRAAGLVRDVELRCVKRDRRPLICLYGGELIELADRPLVVSVIHDITDRVRADEALRENQRVLSTLLSNLPGIVYRCQNDPEWTMEFISEGCRELTGYAPEQLMGNREASYGAIIHGDDQGPVFEAVQQALHDRQPFEFTYRIRTASGTEKWVWERGRGVFTGNGELQALEGFVTDITAKRQAEIERAEALARERRAQSDYTRLLISSQEAERRRIAGELHDSLGQNLLLIQNRAHLAMAGQAGPDDWRGQLRAIRELTSHAIAEVRQISQNLHPYQLDQLGLTRALEAMIDTAAQSSPVTFERKLESVDDAFRVEAATNVYRVVQEAVNNILKHSQASRARIVLERDVRDAHLRIQDNGRGFAMGGLSPEGIAKGFGLKNIAERVRILGGSLKVDSRPGAGTRVEVILPIPEDG